MRASTDGDAIRVRAIARCANLVRTSRPECGCNVVSGGRLFDVVLPRFAVRELSSGTAGTNPAAPAHHAADRQTGKSLQWIERLKRSPSLN